MDTKQLFVLLTTKTPGDLRNQKLCYCIGKSEGLAWAYRVNRYCKCWLWAGALPGSSLRNWSAEIVQSRAWWAVYQTLVVPRGFVQQGPDLRETYTD